MSGVVLALGKEAINFAMRARFQRSGEIHHGYVLHPSDGGVGNCLDRTVVIVGP